MEKMDGKRVSAGSHSRKGGLRIKTPVMVGNTDDEEVQPNKASGSKAKGKATSVGKPKGVGASSTAPKENDDDGNDNGDMKMSEKAKGKRRAVTVEVKEEEVEQVVTQRNAASCDRCTKASAKCIVRVAGAACKRCNGQKVACTLTDKSKRHKTRPPSPQRLGVPEPSTSQPKPRKRQKTEPEPQQPKGKKMQATSTTHRSRPSQPPPRTSCPPEVTKASSANSRVVGGPSGKKVEVVLTSRKRKRSPTLVEPANLTDERDRGKLMAAYVIYQH
jgi:hypothetical protein